MNKVFGDESLTIRFIQQFLYETYNDNLHINSEYYKHFDMNYGFAHYIAKYLDYMYPVLDANAKRDYEELKNFQTEYPSASPQDRPTRHIDNVISIANYFLSDNSGNRLMYGYDSTNISDTSSKYSLYRDIYNEYMTPMPSQNGNVPYFPKENGKYMILNDLPLFVETSIDSGTGAIQYNINNDTIFTLESWTINKKICELDDLVSSYLLGRTITPNSSMEDIYYVQKLLIRNRNILRQEKGVWCMKGAEGTEYDLTQTIINYQKSIVDRLNTVPIFVTGYFDIFTEAQILKEVGEDTYGILGL